MAKILVLFAHPALEKSRVHRKLLRHARQVDDVYIHDLYQVYPDLDIDVEQEKDLLLRHDIVIMQHPFYWYSAPAIIKQWQDLVLQHGWAYGSGGRALAGKRILQAISCGASREVYTREGRNKYTIRELLAPFEQTANLCLMQWLPPFVVHGTHKLNDTDIDLHAGKYALMLKALASESISGQEWQRVAYLNDINPIPPINLHSK